MKDGIEMETQSKTPEVSWNPNVKLIVSDVDETIADVYLPAAPEMIQELTGILEEGKALFIATNGSFDRVQTRILDKIPGNLRNHIIVSHCSGVEVWGFDEKGNKNEESYYNLYESTVTPEQRAKWREIIQQLISEFKLETYDAMPVAQFEEKSGKNPRVAILDDRGPQITFEFINSYKLSYEEINLLVQHLGIDVPQDQGSYDLRTFIFQRAEELLKEAHIPITPRFGGVFALDFAVEGVSKTTAIKHVLENEAILKTLGLTKEDLEIPAYVEIWGDKFAGTGTDRHMSEAFPKGVRSIDFRQEDPAEFMEDYNIVLWDGKKHLHEGLLEYLQSRQRSPR